MATRVVITVPDDVYQRVARLAQLTHRDPVYAHLWATQCVC